MSMIIHFKNMIIFEKGRKLLLIMIWPFVTSTNIRNINKK